MYYMSQRETGPGQMFPEQMFPEQMMPGQMMPGQMMPGQTMPGQTMPGQTMPGQTMPGQTMPGQTMPGQTMPGQMMPGQTMPGQTMPGQTFPGQTFPGQTFPGQTFPGQMPPGRPPFPPPGRPPGRPPFPPGRPPGRPPFPPGRPPGDFRLINDISQAVIKEVHAYNYYTRLAALAPNMRDRQTIFRIQQDEAKHYGWFTNILQRLGARMPMIPPGPMPRNFEEGVREAIRDELEAVTFYQSIASRAQARNIQVRFFEAARDEQEHAGWLRGMLAFPRY